MLGEQTNLRGKNVLVVDDMFDSGLTMKTVLNKVNSKQPKQIKTAVAFHKKTPLNVKYEFFADYIGFLMPIVFVMGYGMDYNGHLRDIPHLCIINKKTLSKFAVKELKKSISKKK